MSVIRVCWSFVPTKGIPCVFLGRLCSSSLFPQKTISSYFGAVSLRRDISGPGTVMEPSLCLCLSCPLKASPCLIHSSACSPLLISSHPQDIFLFVGGPSSAELGALPQGSHRPLVTYQVGVGLQAYWTAQIFFFNLYIF